MPDQLPTPIRAPRLRLRGNPRQRAFRAGLAVVAGAAVGTLCHFVPEEARELCQSLASLARLAVGLW